MAVDQKMIDQAAAALGVSLEQPLKQGGQKTVLLVSRGGEKFVMKVISTGSTLPDALRRATREVELLTTVDDDNVVKVASELVELGDNPDGVAWLEEYLEGEDLSDAFQRPWGWDETKAMALDVARGLAALHAVKVVHRDLSANNVRKLEGGRYVVMDPGYARHTEKSQLTAVGQPGTPGFLSPEHLQGYSGVPNAASDVFSVGILMYLALTNTLPIPFTGDIGDYAIRLSNVTIDDIATRRGDLADPAVDLVRRALHPQPARRYRNGKRLADALEAL